MYELETLRARVEDSDLDNFDNKTFCLRKNITLLVKEYALLEKSALAIIEAACDNPEDAENVDPFNNTPQLQLQVDIQELKMKEEQRLQQVENINSDIQDLHGMFIDLNKMVGEQGEQVDVVENNVEDAQHNVNTGLKHLVKACK